MCECLGVYIYIVREREFLFIFEGSLLFGDSLCISNAMKEAGERGRECCERN